MTTPVNHAVVAVLNAAGIAIPDETKCDEVKIKYAVARYNGGARGGRSDPTSANFGKESHHILQNAAVKDLIKRADGAAVMLDGSDGGVHDKINALQIKRNCPGPGPTNFAELVKGSRDDLATAMKDDPEIEDPKAAADCVAIEAVKEAQQARKDNREKPIKPTDPVRKVKSCFRASVPIWLDAVRRIAASSVCEGMSLWGGQRVVRVDACAAPMVEITTSRGTVALARAHSVRLASRQSRRADRVRVGDCLDTVLGPVEVVCVRCLVASEPAYTFSFDVKGIQPIGEFGLCAEMPTLGPPVRGYVDFECIDA